MSEILTNNKYYKDIADTIRQMKGVATTYKPREMAGALREMYSTEVEGVPPLSFPSNGNNLLNYRIDGASSEVGDRTANLLDYNWLFDYEQKRVNEYFNYIQITLEPNTTYHVTSNYNYNQAQNATAFIVVNSNTDITTANGGIFGSLTVTTTQDGILKIARRIKGNNETMIPKREDFENNSKYIQISINSVNGVGDRTKNLANSNEMIQGYWAYANGDFVYTNTWICTPKIECSGDTPYTYQFSNASRWSGFVFYDENGSYISTSNVQNDSSTEYRTYTATSPSNARYLVVNIAGFPQSTDAISVSDLINFQLEEGPTATDYDPYGYKIPVVINGKNSMPPISEWVDGFINGSGVISGASATNKEKTSPFIPIELNKRYAFSFYPNAGQPWKCVATYDENKNYIARPYSSNTSDPIFLTPSDNVKYLRFSYRTYGDGTYSQLEQNNEVTNYEPYIEPTTTNIYLDEPIGANESKSLSDTNVNIPTINGTNILSIDTTIQPSNVYVQAPKTNNYNL